ncbi:hypothetical protein BGZ81_002993 [Podila clonocystis]|nr:hypothetical protein BGZ81_002993 [Podila clonocystis]
MTSNQVSPLEIPEIVYRIGWFLPLWELEPDKIYNLLPFDVVACLKVNRLWNRTLTPLLWMAFEAYIAVSEQVPKYVIQKYSHHLRYANLNSTLALPIIHATQLRELEVEDMEPLAVRDLTRSNPRLELLDINMNLEIIAISLESIFEPLTNLTRLALRLAENLPLDQVLRPLCHLSKLRSLRLDHFSGLQTMDTLPLHLDSIKELILNCNWKHNPGMHQVVRFCPSLENLEIKVIAKDGPNDLPSADLSKNLRECCPRLRSIRNAQLQEFEWSWAQIPAENATLAPELYERLSGQGWNVFQRGMFASLVEGTHQRELERIFHERAFESVFTLPQMCKIRVGDYFFIKRGYTMPK